MKRFDCKNEGEHRDDITKTEAIDFVCDNPKDIDKEMLEIEIDLIAKGEAWFLSKENYLLRVS